MNCYCSHLSDDETVRANVRDRVDLQDDREIVLHDHVEGGEAAEVEGPVGHLGHLGDLQHHLPSQGLAGGRDGGLGGVVRAVEDLSLWCDLRDREGLQEFVSSDVVYCAGDLHPVTDARLDNNLAVNLEGPVHGFLDFLPPVNLVDSWAVDEISVSASWRLELTCTGRPFVGLHHAGVAHPGAHLVQELLGGRLAGLHQDRPHHGQALLLQNVDCLVFVESISGKLIVLRCLDSHLAKYFISENIWLTGNCP